MADQLSDDQISDLKEAFAIFDFNKDGTILAKDLPSLLRSTKPHTFFCVSKETNPHCRSLGHDPKEEDKRLFDEFDADGTGSMDFPEFLALVARKMREAVKSEEELHDAFR